MKNKNIIRELEKRGITTVEQLIDALNEGVIAAQENIERAGKKIEDLEKEKGLKQEELAKNLLLKSKGVEALEILNGH